MTDKDKIIAEIERLKEIGCPLQKGSDYQHGYDEFYTQIKTFINSLPTEQPSEDLKKEAKDFVEKNSPYTDEFMLDNEVEEAYKIAELTFKRGAQWQKEQMLKSAVSIGYLQDWYQNSIDGEVPPIWTDEHFNELTKDFYIIPKQKEGEQ